MRPRQERAHRLPGLEGGGYALHRAERVRRQPLAAHPGAGEEAILEHALPEAQTATTVFGAFCAILLLPLTVPPNKWWAGGARVRGDRRIVALTLGLLAFHVGVLATDLGRTLFELTPLPVWQYVVLGLCGVAWTLACRLVWRSGVLDGWLGTVEDPYPDDAA